MEINYHPTSPTPDAESSVNYWSSTSSPISTATTSRSVQDAEQYDLLYPTKEAEHLCWESLFYWNYMPTRTMVGEWLYFLARHWVVQYWHHVVTEVLLQRFTHMWINWKTKTLRSFLEVMCWFTVTWMTYQLYHNWFLAIQVGTLIGMFLSICDEMVAEIMHQGVQVIGKYYPESMDVLNHFGFDMSMYKSMDIGKVAAVQSELSIFSTCLFGYTALVTMTKIWDHAQNILQFSYLILMASIMFMIANELFLCWIPTRQLGVSVQSRWFHIGYNWTHHFTRSFLEASLWILMIAGIYYQTQNIITTMQFGAIAGIGICIWSGSDNDATEEETDLMLYEKETVLGNAMYRTSALLSHLY